MLLRWLYTILLTLVSPIFLLSLYKSKPNKPKFGSRWKEHFGVTPPLENQSQAPVWIHTVSVGETIAATPFIRALKQKYPNIPIVITTTTSTGAEQAAKLSDIAEHRYMPLDLPFAIKGFIRKVRPQAMLIMETELWPNTLHYVAKANIPITVINARLSERSANRYQKFQSVFDLFAQNLSKILCQHSDDAKRFIELGMNEKNVHITGSLKFDISVSDSVISEGRSLRQQLGKNRPIWVAASTHQGEDEQVLTSHRQLLQTYPDALLILVPRHPERFNTVHQLCQKEGFKISRRTEKADNLQQAQVYLANTMGEMMVLLASSDVCFMGGSLIGEKVGGHNLLEPAALGLPCITGPSFYNFADITQQLTDAGACFVCPNQAELTKTLVQLFQDSLMRQQCKAKALAVIAQNTGAVERSIEFIKPLLVVENS
ncbi:lipid IV(A) 3-deoxy-D-manno-octulosonic acid transferase [Vibrio algivorus]|uniref:3-deoxy-D-manno-octulosonic acid transferase n=1 Tax=Vibrio algivorus TaxID=1667024 RepID=A0A557P5P8_9VIBR|nr:lipid IV(A) 3-deoxy-D-manno-octulosonic acid transferase [Vibrio algivorus]TVO35949.1 3-deoxy-D-manno-octulosonic acid transferase [Vibrio algivorus]